MLNPVEGGISLKLCKKTLHIEEIDWYSIQQNGGLILQTVCKSYKLQILAD